MKAQISNLCKNLACALLIFWSFSIISCGNDAGDSPSGTDTTHLSKSDTSYNGLEGTRDQSASLSTDVVGDTSSGQSSGKQTTKDSTRRFKK
ncbi:MAG: hypothetical protein WKF89_10210 [Chitinophagaceae bacterium]